MPPLSSKEKVLNFIKSLPDDLSVEEITFRLYVNERILKAQQQIKDGNFLTHEDAKERMKKWLT
ncbi:hypothetical protein LCGC14_0967910 [marine sediment metagenome]|uniref:Uncharacterized protein n=1 Tax=marine sediment metagenome TaxID=412755 RepID=A0A0F9NYM4_9ZZZZ|nr:MAG: hypothetical protein Lokiarch_35870 [Candidatus Lokiarchaeum sp. GC14_75]